MVFVEQQAPAHGALAVLQLPHVGLARLVGGPGVVEHVIVIAHDGNDAVGGTEAAQDGFKLCELGGVVVYQVACEGYQVGPLRVDRVDNAAGQLGLTVNGAQMEVGKLHNAISVEGSGDGGRGKRNLRGVDFLITAEKTEEQGGKQRQGENAAGDVESCAHPPEAPQQRAEEREERPERFGDDDAERHRQGEAFGVVGGGRIAFVHGQGHEPDGHGYVGQIEAAPHPRSKAFAQHAHVDAPCRQR